MTGGVNEIRFLIVFIKMYVHYYSLGGSYLNKAIIKTIRMQKITENA